MQWAGHVAWMADGRRVHKLLLGKLEGKRPPDRSKIRWEYNITWDIMDMSFDGDWKALA